MLKLGQNKIVIFIALFILFGCKPATVTNLIPRMNKVTMYTNSSGFLWGEIKIEIPYKNIIVQETFFSFQKQYIKLKGSYFVSIESFNDTVTVSNGEFTQFTYKKQNIKCSLPSYKIYSEHPIKIHMTVVIYQI